MITTIAIAVIIIMIISREIFRKVMWKKMEKYLEKNWDNRVEKVINAINDSPIDMSPLDVTERELALVLETLQTMRMMGLSKDPYEKATAEFICQKDKKVARYRVSHAIADAIALVTVFVCVIIAIASV